MDWDKPWGDPEEAAEAGSLRSNREGLRAQGFQLGLSKAVFLWLHHLSSLKWVLTSLRSWLLIPVRAAPSLTGPWAGVLGSVTHSFLRCICRLSRQPCPLRTMALPSRVSPSSGSAASALLTEQSSRGFPAPGVPCRTLCLELAWEPRPLSEGSRPLPHCPWRQQTAI